MNRLESEGPHGFDAYVEALVGVVGHADRATPLRDYCLGLMLPLARKSVEPLAAVTAPARVSAQLLAQAAFRQGAGAGASGGCLAARHLARGNECRSRLALRRPARPARIPRLHSRHAAPRGVAVDRVARGRCRAAQILAVHASGGHPAARSRSHGQAALAHRARLSRAQAGTRPGPLRGRGVGRLPPPCQPLRRRLRLPRLRAGGVPPFGTSPLPRRPETSHSPWFTTTCIRPPERHVHSSIATIRRRITIALARSLLRCPCCTRANIRPQSIL